MTINRHDFLASPEKKLSEYATAHPDAASYSTEEVKEALFEEVISTLRDQQTRLFAEAKSGIVVILQAMDAAGKDEAVTTVFSNLSVQGLRESEPGEPSDKELKRDYLWRHHETLPKRGEIAILNRSYYEEVLGSRVHGSYQNEPMPDKWKEGPVWKRRYRHLNEYERYLTENGFVVLKFYLNVNKNVQKKRLLERMNNPNRNWEFSFSDVDDRDKWEDFYHAYDEAIKETSTGYAPWYVIPADDPWFTRLVIAEIFSQTLSELNPKLPVLSGEEATKLEEYKEKLKKQ
ncbi:hypothetical protein BW727_101223 [Jeotgalibaca dankookensis]|uniref:Polyphosphate kinase-2-related domain-containing protein n=1 Tax=Jeotgalibaca dankookensis TaxID=708126 RepID=A0A1S6IQ45_9LACT|nr:PPK2 family polyphosphate kinase [Jeotgalibaca dankookensis]AQS53590.1 hypothetical protein BW727_101223 [Jeotgalibaca dankookensis]